MSILSRGSSWVVKDLVGVGIGLVLVVAMVVDTKFLSPGEAAKLNPAAFSAKAYANENFPKIAASITAKATDLSELAPAVDADPAAAGKQYGTAVGSGKFTYPVKATGTVTEVDANFMVLKVPGVPRGDAVRIPVGAAVSGTPVRDATGEVTFSDFTGQTDFQSVANELKLKMQSVISAIDPPSLKGKQVTVVGAYGSGGPPNSFIIQPVSIESA